MTETQRDETNNGGLIEQLLSPRAYPWIPASVELIETHISWVFLAGDRVVKLKRPVDYGFVDHRELASRHHSCLDEVRLNRRLTTDVYLDVEPIVRSDGELRLGGEGEVVEWATVMRRLPADRMLDVLLKSGNAPTDLATRLANRLLPFHREVAERCDDETCGSVAALLRVVTENLDQLAEFTDSVISSQQLSLVDRGMREFAVQHRPFLAERAAAGWVRDGHGDLRVEHVCLELDGTVQIFDCVEFSRAIRSADIASDLAFLLMDLERVGAANVAGKLLELYRQSGADLPRDAVDFYRSHRALVRAKVACLTATASGHEKHPTAPAEAADYLNLATRSTLQLKPMLLAMTGLCGTGKSTVAGAIARATGATVISSDDVRKRLAGIEGSAAAEWQQGIYGPEWTGKTYYLLMHDASESLASGEPVILDATFLDQRQRQRVADVAADHGVPVVFVETICGEEVAIARILARQALATSRSDAVPDTYARQKEQVARSDQVLPAGGLAVRIDTTQSGPVDLDPLLTALDDQRLLVSRLAGGP